MIIYQYILKTCYKPYFYIEKFINNSLKGLCVNRIHFKAKVRFVFLFLLLIAGISCSNQKNKNKNHTTPTLLIKAQKASLADMSDTLQVYGEIKLRQEAYLASQFDGRLTNFSLINGQHVKKGQQQGIIIPAMREAIMQSLAKLTPSQKQLVSEEVNEIPLFSPISGIVLNVFRHAGDVIKKGEPIAHIANLKQLDVYVDLPVKYIPKVKKIKKFTVSFINFPHSNILLPVSAIGGRVNIEKQTVTVRLSMANPNEIYKPGMRVIIHLPDKIHHNAVVIPRSALLEEEGVNSVFVIKNNIAIKRKVKTGIRYNDKIEILSGLKAGEIVAVEKAYSLNDDMEVKIR